MGLFSGSPDAALSARLSRLERKVEAIMAHLQIQLHEDDGMNEVRDLIAAGDKIGAIKAYRTLTGAGLAEAKEAIDRGLL